jgi:LPXTG-motif cell wall-anchored protein
MHTWRNHAGIRVLALAALWLACTLAGGPALAGPARQTPGDQIITVPAGQTVTVAIRTFCLDFGKPYPGSVNSPTTLAPPAVVAALRYAAGNAYDQSAPDAVQNAIWFLASGTWQDPNDVRAQEIVTAAQKATAPPASAGTSLLAVPKGDLTVSTQNSAAVQGVGRWSAYHGDGTLQIHNPGSSALQVYVPVGAIFPPANAGDQRLVGYAITNTLPATGRGAEPDALLPLGAGLGLLLAGLALRRRRAPAR